MAKDGLAEDGLAKSGEDGVAIAVRADVLAVQPLGIGEGPEEIERALAFEQGPVWFYVRKVAAKKASPEISACCYTVSILTSVSKFSETQRWQAANYHGEELSRQIHQIVQR